MAQIRITLRSIFLSSVLPWHRPARATGSIWIDAAIGKEKCVRSRVLFSINYTIPYRPLYSWLIVDGGRTGDMGIVDGVGKCAKCLFFHPIGLFDATRFNTSVPLIIATASKFAW